jgi:hypothetical protein
VYDVRGAGNHFAGETPFQVGRAMRTQTSDIVVSIDGNSCSFRILHAECGSALIKPMFSAPRGVASSQSPGAVQR